MSGLSIRLATPADDAGICAVLRRNALPGSLSIAFAHEPSFFAAVEVEGHDPRVVVGEQDGHLVGVGLIAFRHVYRNGEPAEVGYLSSLRADPVVRGTTALGRGYSLFRRLHRLQPRVPFYLSTIMEENRLARELLTSGRAGLPDYHEIARYHTLAIPLGRRRGGRRPYGPRIVDGSVVGAEPIARFLNAQGRSRQFYPVYTAEDFMRPTGLLRGLSLRDLSVALAGDRVLGVMGCWDQRSFRQHIVAGYGGALRWLRPAVNATAALRGCRLLPPPGEPVCGVQAACIAVQDDDPAIFRALLQRVLAVASGGKLCFLFLGLASTDPLLPVAREPLHVTLRSRLYAVEWGEGRETVRALDGRVPYLEVGSL